jgi:hypothetical protein
MPNLHFVHSWPLASVAIAMVGAMIFGLITLLLTESWLDCVAAMGGFFVASKLIDRFEIAA